MGTHRKKRNSLKLEIQKQSIVEFVMASFVSFRMYKNSIFSNFINFSVYLFVFQNLKILF